MQVALLPRPSTSDRESQYDMLSTPITTDSFHSRVLALLSTHNAEFSSISEVEEQSLQRSAPKVSPLSVTDTPLTPGNATPQLLAMVSPWIDLCSPDPLIYDISRQVLNLEVAYAAFCGIEYVFLSAPRLYHGDVRTHGLAQYARAVQEALTMGSHLQIHVMLPFIDHPDEGREEDVGSLARFPREEYLGESEESRPRMADIFGTWDAWNVIRTSFRSVRDWGFIEGG
ncbi:MAG: hypothetical protein Q9187_006408 [Circinaria calcarea]